MHSVRILAAALVCLTPLAARPAARATWFPAPLSPRLANYDIQVSFDPTAHTITGRETIRWKNGTAGPTDELYFHLYPNAFASKQTRFMLESGGQLRTDEFSGEGGVDYGYIDVTKLSVTYSGQPAQDLTGVLQMGSTLPRGDESLDDTVMRVSLPAPVAPGEGLEISVSFKTKLPKVFARSGFYGNFHLAGQWFPKLGVLEEKGWNCHAYHANSEFFSDFGVYDVEISAPQNYILAATGEAAAGGKGGTWRFHAEDVHDFAFAASPDFLQLSGNYAGRVAVTVYYHAYQKNYAERHLQSAIAALGWMEKHVGPYPYPVLTVVDPAFGAGGAGGMEYPTFVTTLSPSRGPALKGNHFPEVVTVHEVGHQWFYGLLASNEFEESWLDEGLTQTVEGMIIDEIYGGIFDLYGFKLMETDYNHSGYASMPGLDPILTRAWEFGSNGSYGINSYAKPATLMHTLRGILGAEKFYAGLRLYYARFAFKHPTTNDFSTAMSDAAGRDLTPFFDTWVRSTRSLDYKIRKITTEKVERKTGWFKDTAGWRFYEDGEVAETGKKSGKGIKEKEKKVGVDDPKTDKKTDKKKDAAERTQDYKTTLMLERVGAASLPVDFEVEFMDGSIETGIWEASRNWAKFEWTRSCTAKKRDHCRYREARLDPQGKLHVDLNRMNNSKRRDQGTPAARKATTRFTSLVLIALNLLGGSL